MDKIIDLPTNEKIDPKSIIGWNYLCDNVYYPRLLKKIYPDYKITRDNTMEFEFHEDYFTLIEDGKYKLDIKYNDPHLNNSNLWLECSQ